MARLLLVVVLALAAATLLPPSEASETWSRSSPIPRSPRQRQNRVVRPLFVFGDSSVNCWGNTFLSPLFPVANLSSFGLCKNRLLPDLLAEKMGLPPISPFYSIVSSGGVVDGIIRAVRGGRCSDGTTVPGVACLVGGLNFGSTQGTVLGGSMSSLLFQGLQRQLMLAMDAIEMFHMEIGATATEELVASSVFFLSFGKDDFIDLLSSDSPSVIPKYGKGGFSAVLVHQIKQSIENLYDAGARNILVMGLFPLGCSPRVVFQTFDGLDTKGCAAGVNDLVSDYNAQLSSAVRDLAAQLPSATVAFCDVYAGIIKIISDPFFYGFRDATNACCGLSSFAGQVRCLSSEMECSDPSSYVWWDLYDTTSAVNELLANSSWSGHGLGHLCHPTNIAHLFSPAK